MKPERWPLPPSAPGADGVPGADPAQPLREGEGGQPLLLLHDVDESPAVWERNLGALAATGYEVIAPDLPGFRSAPARGGDERAWRPETAWLHDWLRDRLGHSQVIAAGGGLGGVVAQQLSLWQPGFVERLVLWDCPLPELVDASEAEDGQPAHAATQRLSLPNPTPALLLCGEPRSASGRDFEARAPDVFPDHIGPLRLPAPTGEFARNAAPHFNHALGRLGGKRSETGPEAVAVFVALGSNLGAREIRLGAAVASLRATPGICDVRVSPVYETDPVGPGTQGPYLNSVASLRTRLDPRALLERLQAIENDAGRSRGKERNAARSLDLDLLFYGEVCVAEEDLEVPHPRLHERSFVLEPLADLAPDLEHPRLGARVGELAAAVRDPAGVRRRR